MVAVWTALWLGLSALGLALVTRPTDNLSIGLWTLLLFLHTAACAVLASGLLPRSESTGVQRTGQRVMLFTYRLLQFYGFGAFCLLLPIWWLRSGGGTAAAIALAAAATAWLLSYQRRWAISFWMLYAPSPGPQLYRSHDWLERNFEQGVAKRAAELFWWKGCVVNIAFALPVAWLLLILLSPQHIAVRNWLSFSLLLLPGAIFLAREKFAGLLVDASAALDAAETVNSAEAARAESPLGASLGASTRPARSISLSDFFIENLPAEVSRATNAPGMTGPTPSEHTEAGVQHRFQTDTGEYELPSIRVGKDVDLALFAAASMSPPQATPPAIPQTVQTAQSAAIAHAAALAAAIALPSQLGAAYTAMKAAVSSCDLLQLTAALDAGANPNALPQPHEADQRTALSAAAASGQLKLIKALLAAGAEVNLAHAGLNPLLAATRDSWSGRFDVVMALLSNGADPNVCDPALSTALHGAACSTDTALLQVLKAAGAKLDAVDADGFTPLMRAVQAGRTDNVAWLLKAGAKPEPRWAAPNASSPDVISDAISGAAPDVSGEHRGAPARTEPIPMAIAAAYAQQPDARLLALVGERADLNVRNALGQHPLHVAAMEDAADYLEHLLGKGIAVDVRCDDRSAAHGQTALMLCARHASMRCLQRLVFAKPNVKLLDKAGNSALHHALLAPQPTIAMIEQLLAFGVPAELRNQAGQSAQDLALKIGRWDLARKLSPEQELPDELEAAIELSEIGVSAHSNSEHAFRLRSGVETAASSAAHSREALIVQAATQARLPVVHMLMKLGPIEPHFQQQALIALGDRLDDAWWAALAPHANLDSPEPILVQLARQIPTPQRAMLKLLKLGASTRPDSDGDTALMLICGAAAECEGLPAPLERSPDPQLLSALLHPKSVLNLQDSESRSALSYAVEWCDIATVQLLLDAGANANERDQQGQPVLLRALQSAQAHEKLSALMRAGADPHQLARDGRSVRAVALERGDQALAELLAWPQQAHPGRALADGDVAIAASKGDLEGIKRMVQLGLSVEALDGAGISALAHAAGRGDHAMLEFLLAQGARIGGLPDCELSLTPLGAAVSGRHFDLVRRVVAQGAAIDQSFAELTALTLACANLDVDCATLLLELGASAEPLSSARNPVLSPWHACVRAVLTAPAAHQARAIETGTRLLQTLIQAGADPDALDGSKRSALLMLVSANQTQPSHTENVHMLALLELLLRLGSSALVRDQHSRSVLHWCCRHALFASAEILLDFGADPGAVDEFRKLPVDMATTLNRHDFIALFKGI